MLKLSIDAWAESLAAERMAAEADQAVGTWWKRIRRHAADPPPTATATTVEASRVVLRETARMIGAHLRRNGLTSDQLVPALQDAMQRASRSTRVHRLALSELVEDAVRWGIEGYYRDRLSRH